MSKYRNKQAEKETAVLPVLDERKQHILKAVINDYVMTAEPVGSKTLMQRHNLQYSSATIRNEMAELEELGYLEKPHTSAGRIPSDAGYRLYVDKLLQPVTLNRTLQLAVKNELNRAFDNLTHLLSEAAQYLSGQTGYTSILLAPESKQEYIKHLRMIKTEPGKVMIILVLSAGLIHNRLVRVSDLFTDEQLKVLSAALLDSVNELPLGQIDLLTIEQARPDIEIEESLLEQLIYEAWLAIKQADQRQTYVKGVPNLLRYPEFRDPDKAAKLFSALSNEKALSGVIPASRQGGEQGYYEIRIGQELLDDAFQDCSLVTSTYRLNNGKQLGQINVIGPRRMNYEQVISQVHFVSTTLNEIFGEFFTEDTGEEY